jgi:hypothetical protein
MYKFSVNGLSSNTFTLHNPNDDGGDDDVWTNERFSIVCGPRSQLLFEFTRLLAADNCYADMNNAALCSSTVAIKSNRTVGLRANKFNRTYTFVHYIMVV